MANSNLQSCVWNERDLSVNFNLLYILNPMFWKQWVPMFTLSLVPAGHICTIAYHSTHQVYIAAWLSRHLAIVQLTGLIWLLLDILFLAVHFRAQRGMVSTIMTEQICSQALHQSIHSSRILPIPSSHCWSLSGHSPSLVHKTLQSNQLHL